MNLEEILSNVETDVKNVVIAAYNDGKIVAATIEKDVHLVIATAVNEGRLVLADGEAVVATVVDDVKKFFSFNVATSNNHSISTRVSQFETFTLTVLSLVADINSVLDKLDGGAVVQLNAQASPSHETTVMATNVVSRLDIVLNDTNNIVVQLTALDARVKGLV